MCESSICCPLPPPSLLDDQWNLLHAENLQKHIIPTNNSRWGYLICEWHEKKSNGKILDHRYAACVDLENYTWFIDCSPLKIFMKCTGQLLVRPFHILLKTIYHLSLLHIGINAFKTLCRKQSLEKCLQNSVRSICDIVRTPLFGLALIITSIGALCFGAIKHDSLYASRDLLGKIEQMSNWGEIHTFDTLGECFQARPLSMIERYDDQNFGDTIYTDDPFERHLTYFARSHIRHMRENYEVLYFGKIDPNSTYISPVLTLSPYYNETICAVRR